MANQAECCFLLDAEQLAEHAVGLSILNSPDEEFRQPVDELFEPWRSKHCSMLGVYWHQHIALLFQNGRVVPLVPKDDWMGRFKEVEDWSNDPDALLPAYEKQHPWQDKINTFAWRCAVAAVLRHPEGVQGRNLDDVGRMSVREMMTFMNEELPLHLSRLYDLLSENYSVGASYEPRRSLVNAYEAFLSCDRRPFARLWCAAHRYRCFDLRTNTSGDQDVVLLTDVRIP